MSKRSQDGSAATSKRGPRRTRAERFREVRDAVMTQFSRLRPTSGVVPVGREMHCGPFLILFYPSGALAPDRGCNLNIWPAGANDHGHLVLGNKVVNVDWDQRDNVDILTFRSGPWEGELLSLLRNEGNVRPFG